MCLPASVLSRFTDGSRLAVGPGALASRVHNPDKFLSTVSGAAATVLADYFGESTAFSVDSDVMAGVVRSFPNFAAALSEIKDARIFAGIHYRSACDDGQNIGIAAAQYVMSNSFQPTEGNKEGQIQR